MGDGLGVEGHRRSPAESDAQYEEASSLTITLTCHHVQHGHVLLGSNKGRYNRRLAKDFLHASLA